MEQLSRNRIDYVNVLIVALGGFIIGIVAGYILFGLPSAYGIGHEISMSVDTYIETVKAGICPTAGNQTEIEECMNL